MTLCVALVWRKPPLFHVPHPSSAPYPTPLPSLPLLVYKLCQVVLLFMEDRSGLPTLPPASLLTTLSVTLSQTSLPHSTVISNDSLNELFQFINSQKGPGFPEDNKNVTDSLNAGLDSDVFHPLHCSTVSPAISSSGIPTNTPLSVTGPAKNARSVPHVAYSLDTLSHIGQSNQFNQAHTL